MAEELNAVGHIERKRVQLGAILSFLQQLAECRANVRAAMGRLPAVECRAGQKGNRAIISRAPDIDIECRERDWISFLCVLF